MKIIYILLSLLISPYCLISQSSNPTIKLSQDSIFIGESVNYTISIPNQINLKDGQLVIDLNKIENLAYVQDTNSLEKMADIEIISEYELSSYIDDRKITIPLEDLKSRQYPYQSTLTLGVYSIGVFMFPNPYIISNTGDTLSQNAGTFLFVKPPVGFGQDSTKVINPLKPIIEVPSTWKDHLWILWSLLGLVLISLLAWYLLGRKTIVAEEVETESIKEVIEPAHIVALRRLHILESEAIWQEGKIKEYQSELTNIIREYLEKRYNINALEMTTSDINMAINKEPSMRGQSQVLSDILMIADLVKFAKAKPSQDIHKQFLDNAIDFVNQTKKVENVE